MDIPLFSSILGPPRQQRDVWFFVGSSSSFPNITSQNPLCAPLIRNSPGCKVFLVPRLNSSNSSAIEIPLAETLTHVSGGEYEQVLIFQFKETFHAIINKCPHEAYPLSNATPFEIEDFGIKLSEGITCAKHGWSFDLFTGKGDHGNFKLGTWEVEVRGDTDGNRDGEVWVRRKRRVG